MPQVVVRYEAQYLITTSRNRGISPDYPGFCPRRVRLENGDLHFGHLLKGLLL